MASAPSPVPPKVSEFYQRKRRLAYVFAWLAMGFFLLHQFLFTYALEFFSHPRAIAGVDSVTVFHRCLTEENVEGSRLIVLDRDLKAVHASLRLPDNATALLPEKSGITVIYGTRASVLVNGSNARSFDLGQKWDVQSAVLDGAGTAWIFGGHEGKVLARRRENDVWSAPIEVAASGPLDRLTASSDGAAGLLVAWRERDKTRVRTALFDGTSFVPRAEFELGNAQHWDAVLTGGRILVGSFNRDDSSYEKLVLRLDCCPGCSSPASPRRLVFEDAILLIGRKVTGVAMTVTGDRLRFVVTRMSTIMSGSLPLATLELEPGAKIASLPLDPWWRRAIGLFVPAAMFFCALSLIFLGFALFRERARFAAGGPPPHPLIAGLLPRVFAMLLDIFLLMPVLYVSSGVMAVEEMSDPKFVVLGLIWLAAEFAYHFLMEWLLGWTIGKKILGLKVAEIDGSRVTFRGALIRNLTRWIDSQVPFGVILGLILMLRTPRRQRLGDLLGRTIVVQDLGPEA